jgi:hypothetical protein
VTNNYYVSFALQVTMSPAVFGAAQWLNALRNMTQINLYLQYIYLSPVQTHRYRATQITLAGALKENTLFDEQVEYLINAYNITVEMSNEPGGTLADGSLPLWVSNFIHYVAMRTLDKLSCNYIAPATVPHLQASLMNTIPRHLPQYDTLVRALHEYFQQRDLYKTRLEILHS